MSRIPGTRGGTARALTWLRRPRPFQGRTRRYPSSLPPDGPQSATVGRGPQPPPSRTRLREGRREGPSELEATKPPAEINPAGAASAQGTKQEFREERISDPETGVVPAETGTAICVQEVDVQCVLQFTLIHAAGCALHRHTSRVIHRLELFFHDRREAAA